MLLASGIPVFAQKLAPELYKASTIPDSLKTDANAVVRYSVTEMYVKARGSMVNRIHKITTILNEKGDDESLLVLYYDKKFRSVNSASMIVYDADGKVIKKYRKSDMYDRAAVDGMSIITDHRILALKHDIINYPVTVEISHETNANSYLDLGDWYIQHPEVAVQHAEFRAYVNPVVGFRYKNKHINIKPVKTTENGIDKYTWVVNSLKATKPEDDAPSWLVTPKVLMAANQFSYDDIDGEIDTWQNYGKWQLKVNTDVCTLPPARAEEIRKMTANIKTDKEKAKFLYEYMQQNMRYVSIALGIGGLKPFPATFVDQKKYGDCKALSNYMYAMLKAVNISSYYTMVYGGENGEPADVDFPTDPFNHVILCIPFKNDTTWLECTSNTNPFGSLGTFTENRNALLITEIGGKLVNTPKSKADVNVFNSSVNIQLKADGSAVSTVKLQNTGEYRDMLIGLARMSFDDQKEALVRSMKMKQPAVFNIKNGDDKAGIKSLELEMEYDKFSDVIAGSRQFYKPAAFDLWTYTCPVTEKRKTDFYFDHPLQKNCVTTITLPDGFEVENMPANQTLKFTYGDYTLNYVYDAAKNQVVSTAKFNLNNHIIPAAKYTEMQKYMDDVAKAQNKKLVIKRKA